MSRGKVNHSPQRGLKSFYHNPPAVKNFWACVRRVRVRRCLPTRYPARPRGAGLAFGCRAFYILMPLNKPSDNQLSTAGVGAYKETSDNQLSTAGVGGACTKRKPAIKNFLPLVLGGAA